MNNNSSIYRFGKSIYHKLTDPWYDSLRKHYLKELRDILFKMSIENGETDIRSLSVISSNCFAGRIIQDFNFKYNTPTLGLYFMYPDYIEFLSNLKYYLTQASLTFVEHSKYPLGDERRATWSHWFPIGLLDNKIEIDFLHYHSEEEAAEKWYRRASRVNLDNLLIIGMQQNLCTEKDINNFDALSFKNKILFSNMDIKLQSVEYMPEFKNRETVGDPYKSGHLFYKHLINHFRKKYD